MVVTAFRDSKCWPAVSFLFQHLVLPQTKKKEKKEEKYKVNIAEQKRVESWLLDHNQNAY